MFAEYFLYKIGSINRSALTDLKTTKLLFIKSGSACIQLHYGSTLAGTSFTGCNKVAEEPGSEFVLHNSPKTQSDTVLSASSK